MRVGFIGLGSQGGPMARRIVEGGFETTLWARRAASLEPYAGTAAKTASTPAEMAAASDVVCLCVVGDDDVRAALVAAGQHETRQLGDREPRAQPAAETLRVSIAGSGVRRRDCSA